MENKIREYREKAGLSQTKLGIMAGIATSNMSALERGKVAPWPKVRKALAKILGVSQTELFPENGHGKVSR